MIDNEARQLIEERFAKLAEELQKKYNPVHEKMQCLSYALQTTKYTNDGLQVPLNGPDEIVAAAKKYYEYIKGTTNAN